MFNDYANVSREKMLTIVRLQNRSVKPLYSCCHIPCMPPFFSYPNEDVHSPNEEVSNATPLLFDYDVVKKPKLHTMNRQSPLECGRTNMVSK